MPFYLCRLLRGDGKSSWVFVEEERFIQLLKSKDPLLVSYFEIPSWLLHLKERISTLSPGRVKTDELIDFAKSMAVMLRAGISVVYAIEDFAEMAGSRALRRALEGVANMVRSGSRLSDAFEAYPRVFPNVFPRVVRIGEETGNLDNAFRDIANHLIRVQELRNGVKRALMYPAFVLCSTMGALVFWLVYVLPKMVELFKGMNLPLPYITVVVIEISRFLQKNVLYIFVALLASGALFFVLKRRSERFAYILDALLLKIPIVRTVLSYFILAFVADYLRLLVSSGANIDRALELVAGSVGNRVYRRALVQIKEKVVLGGTLSETFGEFSIFPRFFVRMLKSGEESGTLDEQMGFAADTYYEKLRDLTEKLGKMIEPVILVVVGGLFALIMVSLLFPIYHLVGKIGGM